MASLTGFAARLDVERIIPGHGAPADAAIVGRYLAYLDDLSRTVRSAVREGKSRDGLLAAHPLPASFVPTEGPMAELATFLNGLHRWNLARVHAETVAAPSTSP